MVENEAEGGISLELRDGVAIVTLDRPAKLNALSGAGIQRLTEMFRGFARDSSLRGVLLTGRGRAFCAGGDLSGGPARAGKIMGDFAADSLHSNTTPLIRALVECPKPVVAAVNGLAVGAGMSLAMAADITIAARSASFIQVFTPRLGIVPDAGSTWLLPRAVGRARALGLMMLGESLSAERAAEWGLIWECVDDDALAVRAWQVVAQLAAGPTVGFGQLKRAVAASSGNSLHEQLHLEAESARTTFETEDYVEGTQAFLEKRSPVFRGR